MIHGGAFGVAGQVTAAAAVFASAAVVGAFLQSIEARAGLRRSAAGKGRPVLGHGVTRDAVTNFGLLAAIAYGWAAVAMQGMYLTRLTGLKWQHGWQYAAVMALLCVVALLVSRGRSAAIIKPGSSGSNGGWDSVTLLAIGQALIAGGGLASLLVSGKLWSVRADWAANRVFAGLAVSILVISIATLAAELACAPHRLIGGEPQLQVAQLSQPST